MILYLKFTLIAGKPKSKDMVISSQDYKKGRFSMEIWKPVKNFEGLYEVSNIGRIRSKDKLLKNQYDINTNSYTNTRLIKGRILARCSYT